MEHKQQTLAVSRQNGHEELPAVTFDEFEIPSYDEWQAAVEKLLKGKPFDKSMFTKTYEGILFHPIYRLEDQKELTHPYTYPGLADKLRGAHASGYINTPWSIAQRCDAKTISDANAMAAFELDKGSTVVSITTDSLTQQGIDPTDGTDETFIDTGVSLSTAEDVKALLKDIDVNKHEIELFGGPSAVNLISAVSIACKAAGLKSAELHGAIAADPIGSLLRFGKVNRPLDELYDDMAHTIHWAKAHAPNLKTVLVDADVYHNGGANGIQEAAYALHTALTYMRAMERRGIDVDTFCRHIRFHFSVGATFFMEIAKLRSIKMLWSQLVRHCGGDEDAQRINLYVSTSAFCQTVYDPYVNLLRAASQSFSAVVGGIDGMNVYPFDHCIRPSDEFSRRIARNIQIMEQHEFNFIQPVDPAGGSWYLEPLTEEFTEKSWAKFQELENMGGIIEAIKAGKVQEAVHSILEDRFKKLATRQDRAVGNNMYPNMTEELLEVPEINKADLLKQRLDELAEQRKAADQTAIDEALQVLKDSDFSEPMSLIGAVKTALNAGATFGEITNALATDSQGETVSPIEAHRWTERYEKLRRTTEEFVAETGDNVHIFLANMGPIPQHKARADFVTSFMQVAAFDVALNNGFKTVEDAVAAALESKADVAIVCSTDDTYPELAPAVTKGIKAQRPEMKVFLAGAPSPELKEMCDAAGMDDYISVRSNCYETLLRMQQEKGMIK